MPIIKLVFADDIRRFALEKEADLETIEKLVGSTFNLAPNDFSLNYVDADNDKISISTDEELEEAFQQVQGQPLKINVQKLPSKIMDSAAKDFLRSSKSITNEFNKPVQISPPNTPKSKPPSLEVAEPPIQPFVPIQPKIEKQAPSPLVALLSKRETQDELCGLVMKTLQSPQFMDWAMNNDILPQFFSLMAKVATEEHKEKEPQKPVKAVSEPILEAAVNVIKPQFNSSNSVSIEEDKQQVIKPDEKNENEEEKPAEELVKKEPVILGEEQQENVAQQKEPGLVQSLLSIFKSKKEHEEEIPNQEEILKKLADMGFTDKEANLKALRFHKKYNEGLDEVVEDLLLQRTGAKPAEERAIVMNHLPEINSKS